MLRVLRAEPLNVEAGDDQTGGGQIQAADQVSHVVGRVRGAKIGAGAGDRPLQHAEQPVVGVADRLRRQPALMDDEEVLVEEEVLADEVVEAPVEAEAAEAPAVAAATAEEDDRPRKKRRRRRRRRNGDRVEGQNGDSLAQDSEEDGDDIEEDDDASEPVEAPLAEIAPLWRHPRTGLTVAQMLAVLDPAALAGMAPLA